MLWLQSKKGEIERFTASDPHLERHVTTPQGLEVQRGVASFSYTRSPKKDHLKKWAGGKKPTKGPLRSRLIKWQKNRKENGYQRSKEARVMSREGGKSSLSQDKIQPESLRGGEKG